ncbi:GtrA family protein [Novosphingobium sp.]|uniref:GtrA family protein n=1 Tax=Novosphingobium sp. TaxID=1874826 RepID=UPI00333E753C
MNGLVMGAAIQPVQRVWRNRAKAPAVLANLLTGTFARYLSASVVALGADAGSFLVLLNAGMAPAPAAAAGFMLGIVVNWLVSSRVMFAASVAVAGPERRRQQALFLASAMVGLVLTTVIVGWGASHAINPRLAKLVAVGVSFITTSGLRHVLVFGKPRQG